MGGGTFPHNTFPNFNGRPHNKIDDNAQIEVAETMLKFAQKLKPKFIINVGDNIYPGGIGGPGSCNPAEGKFDTAGQAGIVMSNTYAGVYNKSDLSGIEWWGVLGNHDYGGYYYSTHWDQFVYYTWEAKNWVIPALYWSRKVQYSGFSVDFFFLDTNICDVKDPMADPEHNICNKIHNEEGGYPKCGGTIIKDAATCEAWFTNLWKEQEQWLKQKLDASDADWQIVVSHYPPQWGPAIDLWKEIFPKYGVDLFLSGHTHEQRLMYKADDWGDTAYIISGGGGGISSEQEPALDGNDDAYGFVDIVMCKDKLEVNMYSHGSILRNTTIITPRSRSQDSVGKSANADEAQITV